MTTGGKGWDFARNVLEKYGWREGRGLGRKEDGIAKALKPALKLDNAGFGHAGMSEQFTSRWWEQAYNKVARNITVVKNEENIEVKHENSDDLSKCKSARPPVSTYDIMDYNSFVKGSDVVAEDDVHRQQSSEVISTLHISDDEIFRVCGGRTVHKGARHGLKLNGKLARIQRQEEEISQRLQDSQAKQCYSYQVEESSASKVCKRKQDNVQEVARENLILPENRIICDSSRDVSDSVCSSKEKKKKKSNRDKEMTERSSDTKAGGTPDSIIISSTLVSDVSFKKLKSKKKNRTKKELDENRQPIYTSDTSAKCSIAFPPHVSDMSIEETIPKERSKKRKDQKESRETTDQSINYSVKDLLKKTERNNTEVHKGVKRSKRKDMKETYIALEDTEHGEVPQEVNSTLASFPCANNSSSCSFQRKVREENRETTDQSVHYFVKESFEQNENNRIKEHKSVKRIKRKDKETYIPLDDSEYGEVPQEVNSVLASFPLANNSSCFKRKACNPVEILGKTSKKKCKKAKQNN